LGGTGQKKTSGQEGGNKPAAKRVFQVELKGARGKYPTEWELLQVLWGG